jgi:flagellar biosynthesis protein
LASGSGELAERIIALAQANGIPLRADPALASALAGLEVDDLIPPELYAVVAEILAFVYRIHHPPGPDA